MCNVVIPMCVWISYRKSRNIQISENVRHGKRYTAERQSYFSSLRAERSSGASCVCVNACVTKNCVCVCARVFVWEKNTNGKKSLAKQSFGVFIGFVHLCVVQCFSTETCSWHTRRRYLSYGRRVSFSCVVHVAEMCGCVRVDVVDVVACLLFYSCFCTFSYFFFLSVSILVRLDRCDGRGIIEFAYEWGIVR